MGGPFLGTTFSIQLPAGVEVKGWASSPKVSTQPVVSGSTVTWNLGANVSKIKVVLKLVASASTTPDDVKLYGKFGYTDTAGAQLVDACLKKPLYVWTKNCRAIPKMLPKGQGQYSQCTCSICEVGLGVAFIR